MREGFGAVKIAGEPERAWRAKLTVEGVPVDGTTWHEILGAATSLGVNPAGMNAAAGLA